MIHVPDYEIEHFLGHLEVHMNFSKSDEASTTTREGGIFKPLFSQFHFRLVSRCLPRKQWYRVDTK